MNNTVKHLEQEYKKKSKNLDFDYNNRKDELENEYKEKSFELEYKYRSKIHKLEKENNHLYKIIDKFYETVDRSIEWICKKFGIGESKELVRDFEKETNILIDSEHQLKHEKNRKRMEFRIIKPILFYSMFQKLFD